MYSKDESLSTAAIVGIALGTLFVLTIIGGVAGFMWYNYSKRSTRVETVNLQGDGKAISFATFMSPEVMQLFSCSAQLRLKFILLINVKM